MPQNLNLPPHFEDVPKAPELPTIQPVDFQVGQFVDEGNYQILERVHQGERTEIYRAMSLGNRAGEAALKVFHEPAENISHQVDWEMGVHLELAGQPGVVDLLGAGILKVNTRYYRYMATPFAKNGTYKDFMIKHPGDPETAVKVAASIMPALEAAHELGIVHRDVKPANVLSADDTEHWEMNDFGLAQWALQNPNKAGTKAMLGGVALDMADTMAYEHGGDVLGTPGFIAPEAAQDRALTPQVDIFPLGVMMFQGATGKLPYFYTDRHSYAKKIIKEGPVSARTVNSAVPASLDMLIQECLQPNPLDRPTAEELIHEVDEVLEEIS